MTPEAVIHVIRQALWTAFWLSAPLLLVGFIAGVIVSLVQIVTSMQDSAFSAIPRLVAFLVAAVVFLPWMLHYMVRYTAGILGDLARYAR